VVKSLSIGVPKNHTVFMFGSGRKIIRCSQVTIRSRKGIVIYMDIFSKRVIPWIVSVKHLKQCLRDVPQGYKNESTCGEMEARIQSYTTT